MWSEIYQMGAFLAWAKSCNPGVPLSKDCLHFLLHNSPASILCCPLAPAARNGFVSGDMAMINGISPGWSIVPIVNALAATLRFLSDLSLSAAECSANGRPVNGTESLLTIMRGSPWALTRRAGSSGMRVAADLMRPFWSKSYGYALARALLVMCLVAM
jgi:hypothetical protein